MIWLAGKQQTKRNGRVTAAVFPRLTMPASLGDTIIANSRRVVGQRWVGTIVEVVPAYRVRWSDADAVPLVVPGNDPTG
ncbi:MAG: DUF1918 domain-containing protein [Acidimicrobiia bacterium]|nr:DUF1918 domain-containing protein [Acidimicrobiia bacterium]